MPNRRRRRLLLASAAIAATAGLAPLPVLDDAASAGEPDNDAAGQPRAGQLIPQPVFRPDTPLPSSVLGTDGPSLTVELPPFVRPREAWGAAPPAQPYVLQAPKGVSLHHTGAPYNGKPGPEQYLRNIQTFHTGPQREWEDIAYHYLIDLDGKVWAGRPPTVRGNPSIYYDPTGLVLICFLGDYSVQELSEPQIAAACKTAAWVIRRFGLPPGPITGHRDHAPTTCPGSNVYRLIQEGGILRQVQALLK